MAKTDKRGLDLIKDPILNKSTAFSLAERDQLGLQGLIPDKIETIEIQLERALMQLEKKKSDLERYIFLNNLLDHNETLFYKVVMSDPKTFLPIVYAPTIGDACLQFGHIYRQARGFYLSIVYRNKLQKILSNWPDKKDIRVICVTDGGRILGLGDLGANGMGIPIGKLQLYTVAAGVNPSQLLPIYLDAGTNNESLLSDPLYLGLKQKRPSSEELYSLVDEFVEAVQHVFPGCCIHFEDWTGVDAVNLLARYRDRYCCFNDDIQGTAATTLSCMINANRIKGTPLKDERYLFLGAGSAAIGLADMLSAAAVKDGLSLEQARTQIHMMDVGGLLDQTRTDLMDFQRPYAHPYSGDKLNTFVDAINAFKPTTIIGVSTVGGSFTQEVVEAISKINDRPVILALSNPTSHAECTAQQAYQWSEGKAIFAAGVQFDDVLLNGKRYIPTQANNCYIFPAVGLAITVTKAKRVPDDLFVEAAHAVADQVTAEQLVEGLLFPLQNELLDTSIKTAIRVATLIFDLHLAGVDRPADVAEFVRQQVYKPEYVSLV